MSVVIEVKNVTKIFKRHTKKYFSIKSAFVDFIKHGRPQVQIVKALDNISFDMVSGSTLGIIGKNGAGKSTLLKIISGIIKPTSGSVKVKGSLVPLLELGTGFHPELTGRENIIISGLILGLSKKEIYKKIDEIIEFAELKDVIDEPVRTYSSGMYSRLAFSTAFSIDPDIIILDEILSVGDIAFMKKSKEKVKEFKRRNKTILFVSHDMTSVKEMCDEAIYIDKGRLIQRGKVDNVVSLCGL
ncbi:MULTISPECIES: ABC transporter ATP-binding protein [unclassified Hydrogenobaculum]|uniref:ABC transporter ATP-binding protein n=1 Tax=unclassified Hydrogenobaculum TaxID=2622382 RepID=UPI0001C52214|nr:MULTISPECIES: ABC transporter ATP-binding protein [unclassified Hydrogenobaculum]AEF19904.1 Teichoic-acid-transporting ATPase [Hydrogenobaculum sp. 3684]AEG47190.1 Teichoic-acid-transporting ATPase [Hydrogenobaculum sp. SHO]AGG15838.1 ABC transporter related protein [Hydrogenobaculum sp. HO]AGH94138.1 ABC-type polysaccharide/polyol phosphate transport system, ATPase component [Hydrogenobaculum sp. SN]